jgi:DNA-binding CsgD family transcriptional regulator/tetratricopeptide (TPR) repeat protein
MGDSANRTARGQRITVASSSNEPLRLGKASTGLGRSVVGRDGEQAMIADLLDSAHARGASLVVHGDAGTGKSALLDFAGTMATRRGMQVLRTAGVQSETKLPFAGLQQLLRPLISEIDRLPSLQREAVGAAFGISGATAPALYLIALAALELLSPSADRAPVVAVVDDAQWLDRPSVDVLTFVARRVEADRIILLASLRDGHDSPLLGAGLPELLLTGLDERSARVLVLGRFPELAPAVCERVLTEAAGNPLALLELPIALGSAVRTGEARLPAHLPLTARIEQAFVARVSELPCATRALLRVAAANDGGVLAEILSAAEIVDPPGHTINDFVPAIDASLISVDGHTVHFRHPLVRSAIHQASSLPERQTVHAALAEVLADDPDRRVWHLAAAAVGRDPVVAKELEAAAWRAHRRGARITAAGLFERAADFVADRVDRAELLLSAAAQASELGRSQMVLRLLREADSLEPDRLQRARSLWLADPFRDGPAGDPCRVQELVETATRVADDGDTELAVNLLSAAAFRCFWGDRQDAGRSMLMAADRIGVVQDDPRLLQIQAYAAPIERGAVVLDHLRGLHPPEDPYDLYLLGTAACIVGAFEEASSLLGSSAARLRDQGRLGVLARVLETRAWSAMLTADFGVALPAAEEAAKLAAETDQPLWQAGAWIAQSALAALRGEYDSAEELAAAAERVALPAGAPGLLGIAQYARGLSALGQGRHAEALDQLRRLSDRRDPAHHHMMAHFAIGDLAEAAVHTGDREYARAELKRFEPLVRQAPSPWFRVVMLFAEAVLAEDHEAEALFAAALQQDLTSWPMWRARLQLAFGGWLRRQRRSAESRAPLRAARDTFDALGVVPWSERARQELRASGETSRRRVAGPLTQLTPQEIHIVQMAAAGLTNPEIAQRLYLSRRTVESHLYRVFPKIGVTSRAQLQDVLAHLPLPPYIDKPAAESA